jgi:glycosyltransferase involved in cell wall biosynthesis
MSLNTFITTYKPIICGIATYTDFIIRESPIGSWDVLSFDLDNCRLPLSDDKTLPGIHVRYCIPSYDDYSASSILKGLEINQGQVLWFQHEFGIWRSDVMFVEMLKNLDNVKIVTLHSLHFQSSETPYGLRRNEFSFLRLLLRRTDAITVFSDGVHEAISRAFPEYSDKVYLLRHGTHLYPKSAKMSREEAKAIIHEYLVGESDLGQASKDNLSQQGVFLDPEMKVIGGTGFISASKGIEPLFQAHNALQQMLPRRKIAAVYAGFLRDSNDRVDGQFAMKLRTENNRSEQYFLETYLPEDMLPVMLRALDIYFYWPNDCTQSGIMAHALGAGATIACRDMEGVGETVKMAGGVTNADFGQLVSRVKQLILDPRLGNEMSENASKYAEKFSWRNQALCHFELAEQLCRSTIRCSIPTLPLVAEIPARRQPSLTI